MSLFASFDGRVLLFVILLLSVAGWQGSLFRMLWRFRNGLAVGWIRRTMMMGLLRWEIMISRRMLSAVSTFD